MLENAMNINGTYKINVEQSARKQVDGILATTKRLLGYVSKDSISNPPGKEEHIQNVIQMFNANKDIIEAVTMTIADDSITINSSEGTMVCQIERIEEKDPNHVTIYHNNDEEGRTCWCLTLCDPYLFLESDDELADYVFERK
jgi:hypothetical protein